MDWDELTNKLDRLDQEAEQAGGQERIEVQHKKGKLSARERIYSLIDPGSFEEFDKFATHQCQDFGMDKKKFLGDAVVAGSARIDKRQVFIYSQDYTVLGGTLGYIHSRKICKLFDLALKTGAPVIGLHDSGGARIQEGIQSLAGYGEIFLRNTKASGIIPQIALIMGPCAGGAVYSPALMDFILMTKNNSFMFITGPEVVEEVTGEKYAPEELGGSELHSLRSGVCDLVADDDESCIQLLKRLLRYLPSNNKEDPPFVETTDSPDRLCPQLREIIPTDMRQSYSILSAIETIFDKGSFLEIKPNFAKNLVIGFARLGGFPVGVVANQPASQAGVLDSDASRKGARFVRFCDAFNFPIITLVDVPGFMPGRDEEAKGIIVHGAKLIYAYAEATVPKISLVIRKAYGGAYIVMSSKHLAGDLNFAYPSAEIAVMGPESAIRIIYSKELKGAKDAEAMKKELVQEYKEKFAGPYLGAGLGYIDEIISPDETRIKLFNALKILLDKVERTLPKKHGNPPL